MTPKYCRQDQRSCDGWGRGKGPHISQPLWINALDVGGPSSIDFIYFWGSDKKSNAMGEEDGARSAPVWGNNKLKKTGARSARARTRGQNPLVQNIFTEHAQSCHLYSLFSQSMPSPATYTVQLIFTEHAQSCSLYNKRIYTEYDQSCYL